MDQLIRKLAYEIVHYHDFLLEMEMIITLDAVTTLPARASILHKFIPLDTGHFFVSLLQRLNQIESGIIEVLLHYANKSFLRTSLCRIGGT